jgi:hypothetical protein
MAAFNYFNNLISNTREKGKMREVRGKWILYREMPNNGDKLSLLGLG